MESDAVQLPSTICRIMHWRVFQRHHARTGCSSSATGKTVAAYEVRMPERSENGYILDFSPTRLLLESAIERSARLCG